MDHSHEHSVIPAILKRGYYRPQVNVGTLHARVISTGKSLASKDHSHEQSVIPAILKRGYYHPQVNVGPCQHISYWSITIIPSSMSVSSSLPLSREDPYYQTTLHLSKEGSCLRPSIPFRRRSIYSSYVVPSLFLLAWKVFRTTPILS